MKIEILTSVRFIGNFVRVSYWNILVLPFWSVARTQRAVTYTRNCHLLQMVESEFVKKLGNTTEAVVFDRNIDYFLCKDAK